MGQYHIVVNLDKREFIHPHQLGSGLKLWEQMAAHPGTGAALIALLAVSNGRGGGDLHDEDDTIVGRWGGDRIAIVGDYAAPADLPAEDDAESIYFECGDDGSYTDITPQVCALIERLLCGKFEDDGWRNFVAKGIA